MVSGKYGVSNTQCSIVVLAARRTSATVASVRRIQLARVTDTERLEETARSNSILNARVVVVKNKVGKPRYEHFGIEDSELFISCGSYHSFRHCPYGLPINILGQSDMRSSCSLNCKRGRTCYQRGF